MAIPVTDARFVIVVTFGIRDPSNERITVFDSLLGLAVRINFVASAAPSPCNKVELDQPAVRTVEKPSMETILESSKKLCRLK